jgi:pyruvate kinase
VVDLPGPKLRTDICEREAGLIHIRRSKDSVGRTTTPSRVHLVATASAPDEIPVPAAWLPKLRRGDIVWVTQPDGRRRRLTVASVHAGGVDAHCTRSLYVVAGAALEWHRKTHRVARAKVGDIAEVPRRVTLCVGDLFLVNADGVPDMPGRIALALRAPEVLSAVRAGERVLLDDGRVVATVQSTGPNGLLCAVTAAVKPSVRLRSGKGIAFPDSDLRLDALGEDDEVALAFALEHADAAGVSFVNDAADVDRVGERIGRSARPGFGMILKLETRSAMRNLQSILFQAMHYDPVGLMIARGDLAIDIGFARLAEIQEELLWFGEACHLPVVWATQVLESVTHTGLPTRAEVTDAAMSMRAECVMLNKGPHVATANRFLADIIRRMEMHQYKKRALYRPLSLASLLPDNAPPG